MTITKDLIYDELKIATTIVKSAYVDFEEPIIEDVKISHARSFWGQIKSLGGRYFELKVSDVFNDIPNEDKAKGRFRGMLVHELLHTIKGCMNHGNKWKLMASKVNALYPSLNVTRCTSMSSYGVKKEQKKPKYWVICHACNHTWFRQRKSDTTDPVFLNTFCRCGHCNAKGQFEVMEV